VKYCSQACRQGRRQKDGREGQGSKAQTPSQEVGHG